MAMTLSEAEALTREAIDALRAGNGAMARERFERAIAGESGMPAPWLLLAQACHLTGDDAAQEAALDRLLATDMRNLPALLMMGELKARNGDDRAANSCFTAALNMAAQSGNAVPQSLAPLLGRAQSFLAESQRRFEAHLHNCLNKAGLDIGPNGRRICESLDLLHGRSEIFLQQPSMFYFPGLPQRQFYERDEFPWLAEVEAAVPAMQDELQAVLADEAGFAPYVEAVPGRPRPNNPLLENPDWSALYFWKGGVRIAENADCCPRTMAALEAAPIPVIEQRSPMALYSLLRPGTHIQPHHGLLNTRLICHIPLIVPGDCALRVGNETRAWEEGKALIFDDSIEHEAWNRSDRTRIILLFEIWRPEIGAEERTALTAIFEAINEYQGAPTDTA